MIQAPQSSGLMTLAPALIGAAVAIFVLVLTDTLTRRRESKTRRQIAAMQYRERQLGEFYGPLLGLIEQIQRVYSVKTRMLKAAKDQLSGDQKNKIEDYFWETHFNPLHIAVRELFKTKLYLLENGKAPKSFDTYFTHSVQEKAQRDIARSLGIDTSFLEGVPYPRDLDTNVKAAVDNLMALYESDIARMKS